MVQLVVPTIPTIQYSHKLLRRTFDTTTSIQFLEPLEFMSSPRNFLRGLLGSTFRSPGEKGTEDTTTPSAVDGGTRDTDREDEGSNNASVKESPSRDEEIHDSVTMAPTTIGTQLGTVLEKHDMEGEVEGWSDFGEDDTGGDVSRTGTASDPIELEFGSGPTDDVNSVAADDGSIDDGGTRRSSRKSVKERNRKRKERKRKLQEIEEKMGKKAEANEDAEAEDDEDDDDGDVAYSDDQLSSGGMAAATAVALKRTKERVLGETSPKKKSSGDADPNLCQIYGTQVIRRWKTFLKHYEADDVPTFVKTLSSVGKDGKGTPMDLATFSVWLVGAKSCLGLRHEEIKERLVNHHDIVAELHAAPTGAIGAEQVRCISGKAKYAGKPEPETEEDKDDRVMGTNYFEAADSAGQAAVAEALVAHEAAGKRKCAMLGAVITGPPWYNRWLTVKGKRQAHEMRRKFGIDMRQLEAFAAADNKPTVPSIMDGYPMSILHAPPNLMIAREPDLSLIKGASCFTGVVCGLTVHNPKLKCGKRHKKGVACGENLKVNDVVFVNGRDCTLIDRHIYYIGVNRVERNVVKICRVGVLKCLGHQVQYFANRMAQVTSVKMKAGSAKEDAWISNVGGVAEIGFLDTSLGHHRDRDATR